MSGPEDATIAGTTRLTNALSAAAGTRSRRAVRRGAAVGIALLAGAGQLHAQSLAARVAAVADGTVVFRFAARPGVCGNGENRIRTRENSFIGRWNDGDRAECCVEGPVRVALRVRDGRLAELRTTVGPEPHRAERAPVTDLGTVAPSDAAGYLLGLARSERGEAGEDAVLPATLADGVEVWPELLEIARDAGVRRDTRKAATFWVGQAAADAVTDRLGDLAADDDVDLEVRKHAVFALSRRPDDEAVPALIRVARSDGLHPGIRRAALFWLGRTDDPRALEVFERILLGRGR